MQIFGLEITRRTKAAGQLASVDSRGGWWPVLRESFAGAWQQNIEVSIQDVLRHPTVFSCITLIANDIGKLNLRLVQVDDNGIWTDATSAAFSPILRKFNRYQNRIQFIAQWLISKLISGNTYALKERDGRGVVTALYILDPSRVRPLVAPDGSVFYALKRDDLSGVRKDLENLDAVPASEIIHDRFNCLYHPLVGMGPLFASGLAAMLGLKIQTNSTYFFGNGSNPGGVLTAPGAIGDETAKRLKAYWDANFTGANAGKVAVLGDGLKYEPMAVTADKSQLTEQWRGASEAICSTYHVPKFMAGVGEPPPYANIEAVNILYYSQCLQELIESLELCLDEGIGLGPQFGNRYGTEFDVDDLLRMDTATQITALSQGVLGTLYTPNAARKKLNQPPVKGGDTAYLQQQNYSLEALARRDEMAPAPPITPDLPTPPSDGEPPDDPSDDADMEKFAASLLTKVAELHAA